MPHLIYIALGTNMGDCLENLRLARQALAQSLGVLNASPIYQTPPWGYLDQADFLNQVVQAETDLSPVELLRLLKRLEGELGRQPGIHNGPRQIDLDFLFYDDLVLEAPGLTLPHPRIAGRGFVLVPLSDLAPDLRHPLTGQTVKEMLAECDLRGIIPIPSTDDLSGKAD